MARINTQVRSTPNLIVTRTRTRLLAPTLALTRPRWSQLASRSAQPYPQPEPEPEPTLRTQANFRDVLAALISRQ